MTMKPKDGKATTRTTGGAQSMNLGLVTLQTTVKGRASKPSGKKPKGEGGENREITLKLSLAFATIADSSNKWVMASSMQSTGPVHQVRSATS
jgi:hypothetical protein